MTANSARKALHNAGEVKQSAADMLRAALNPPREPEKKMSWLDIATELKRANDNFEAERKAAAEAAANAPDPAKPLCQLLAEAIGGGSSTASDALPLNGEALLKHAASGLPGAKINSESTTHTSQATIGPQN